MKGSAPSLPARHPALSLLLLLGLLVGAFCVAMFLVVVYAKLVLGTTNIGPITANPAGFRRGWDFLMVTQGLTLLVGFGGAALAFASFSGLRWADYFAPRRLGSGGVLLLAAVLIIGLLPLMSALVEWNMKAHFPAFLRGFEVWARAAENRATASIKFLTQFNSPDRFLVGVLVVAVVPAIAEELFFRGVVQRVLVQWFSPHVGVWLAAAIFSAIHFQFFGFFPRFVLGLVLGYLYLWSGNIVVSMAAHFTQNGFQLLLLYLQQRGKLGAGFDPDATTSLPWPLVVGSALLSAGLLFELHRRLRPTISEAPAGPLAAGSGASAAAFRSGDGAVKNQFS